MDLLDLLVQLEPPQLSRDQRVLLALLVLKVFKVQLAPRELLAQPVLRVFKDPLAHKDLLVLKVFRVFKE